MSKTLIHEKIAILVANGFNEAEMTTTQKMLQKEGAYTRLISMDSGLVNSWTGMAWGHHFAADSILASALAADFSMLLIPGGRRAVEKLKLTAHTQRFINAFLNTGKPLALMGDAVELLSQSEVARGRGVCGPDYMEQVAQSAGLIWHDADAFSDSNLMTCRTTPDVLERSCSAIVGHFGSFRISMLKKAA